MPDEKYVSKLRELALEGKIEVIQCLLCFFNLLFCLSGLALIVTGAVIKVKYGDYLIFVDNKYATAAVLLLAVGVIVFVISFFGCCGALRENYCMVTTFAVLLTMIFILEIAAAVLGFAFHKDAEEAVEKALDHGIKSYNNKEKATVKFYDWLQTEFRCCGNKGISDWPAKFKPESCKTYKVGCKDKFESFVQRNLAAIGGLGFVFALVQVLGIAFAYCLRREIRDRSDDPV